MVRLSLVRGAGMAIGQQVEDAKRRRLGERSGIANRPDAARAPFSHGHSAISRRVPSRSSSCMRNSGSLKPMPPG